MIQEFSIHDQYLNLECYSLIVRIASLLTYYNFELNPVSNARFQNCKKLYSIGTNSDLPNILYMLNELESGLIYGIWMSYGIFVPAYAIDIWKY